MTSGDPERNDLFERFVSAERDEPPDIDVDFEHARRGTVIQWIYATYGRPARRRIAAVGPAAYGARGAVRRGRQGPGRARGRHPRASPAWSGAGQPRRTSSETRRPGDMGLDLSERSPAPDAGARRGSLLGTPRHFGQHPGGFVLTRDRLDHLVPVGPGPDGGPPDRRVGQGRHRRAWSFMKVDVLGLGMLTCLAAGPAISSRTPRRDQRSTCQTSRLRSRATPTP
ncbi:hypothetical protein ACRAWD_11350 [Caulobacter segnis]